MGTYIVPPVTIIAAASAAVFYMLYAFAYTGGIITSFIFLTAVLSFCMLSVFLITVAATGKLPPQGREGRRSRNRVRSVIRFALCIMAGAAIGSYSVHTLQREQRPPQTLASLPTVRTLIAELTGEPVPAGVDYYRLPVKLIACSTGRA